MQALEFTVRIEGYLAKDAVTRTYEGTPVTNLRLLHTKRFFDTDLDQWVDGKTMSIDIACWRELSAPNADLKKGTRVLIEASDITSRAYNGKGYTQATATKITVTAPPKNRTAELAAA